MEAAFEKRRMRLGRCAGLIWSLAVIAGCAPRQQVETRPVESEAAAFQHARESVERCVRAGYKTMALPRAVAREIEKLGGPKAAVENFRLYLRSRGDLAPDRDIVPRLLGHCGAEAVPALLELLRDEQYAVRKGAAESLKEVQGPAVAGKLAAALGSGDERVQWVAAAALCNVRREDRPSIEAIKDQREEVRSAAAKILQRIEETHRAATRGSGPGEMIGAFGTPERAVERIELLLYARASSHWPGYGYGCTLMVSLGHCGKPAFPLLIEVLHDRYECGSTRQVAAGVLARATDPEGIEAVIRALHDQSTTSYCAAYGLSYTKNPRAVEALINALGRDYPVGARRQAAVGLGLKRDPRAVEPLIAALKDSDAYVRGGAAEALGKLKDPRAVEPLMAALKDTDKSVRRAAAAALERLGDERAVPALEAAAAGDAEADVREAARKALEKIRAQKEQPKQPLRGEEAGE
jgi:HEAT repeat protein